MAGAARLSGTARLHRRRSCRRGRAEGTRATADRNHRWAWWRRARQPPVPRKPLADLRPALDGSRSRIVGAHRRSAWERDETELLNAQLDPTEEDSCFRTKTMKGWSGSARARRLESCSGSTGFRFCLRPTLIKDGQPKRVRLLGEDLVAFRDTEGRVGLVDQACPHRGAPLIFGRNEDCGLRCVYHGWKFDVTGAVTDMPAEPARSRLKERARIKAYPCQERNGMLWTYMGPDAANPPPLPNLEWNLVPQDQVHISVRVQECNWLQAARRRNRFRSCAVAARKAGCPGHDQRVDPEARPASDLRMHQAGFRDEHRRAAQLRCQHAVLAGQPVHAAVLYAGPAAIAVPGSERPCLGPDRRREHALHHVLLSPVATTGAEDPEDLRGGTQWPRERARQPPFAGSTSRHRAVCGYWTKYNPQNGFQFDYGAQQTTWFSGLPGLWVQDGACQSGVSPIFDRTKENAVLQRYRHCDDPADAARDRSEPIAIMAPSRKA